MSINLDTLDAIDQLKPLAEELNAESNDLNQIITVISERLAALNLGIEVWFPLALDDDSEVGFGKLEGSNKWSLAVRTKRYVFPDSPTYTMNHRSLTQCSRDERIEGLALVRQIVTSLQTETTNRLKKIAEAKQLAAGL